MPAPPYYHRIILFAFIFLVGMNFVAQSSVALQTLIRGVAPAVTASAGAKRGKPSASYIQFIRHCSSSHGRNGRGRNPSILAECSRQYSASVPFSTTARQMTIADTPLGTKEGALLLDGLDIYSIPAKEDNHPLTVFGIESSNPQPDDHILLMLHGRTWSSVPVYHLLGGPKNAAKGGIESRSLMEALVRNKIQVYTMDFRGFGGTPKDATGAVEPNRCMEDVESVLAWLAARHGCSTPEKISLMGWSQGALVAQLAAQRRKPLFSRLILYGSIYDPLVRYPREPLYIRNRENMTEIANSFDAAVEDFTIEGTIPPKAATIFAETALLSDPIKAKWKSLYQFNTCDPARVHVPTLVVRLLRCVCLS
jgi:pimeloyl-ACP methyl ester carboxylesterase